MLARGFFDRLPIGRDLALIEKRLEAADKAVAVEFGAGLRVEVAREGLPIGPHAAITVQHREFLGDAEA